MLLIPLLPLMPLHETPAARVFGLTVPPGCLPRHSAVPQDRPLRRPATAKARTSEDRHQIFHSGGPANGHLQSLPACAIVENGWRVLDAATLTPDMVRCFFVYSQRPVSDREPDP